MQNSVIKMNNSSIVQDEKIILQKANLEMFSGELIYLIGKVGSGKTSLLKTLYADLPLAAGTVMVNGFDLGGLSHTDIPFLRRTLGIVFQDFKLLTDRNIHDNLRFVLEATGWKDDQEINKRIIEVLNEVELAEKESKMPNELSGGEQQRVVIARALLNHPPVILADEPTGNLDPESSKHIMQILELIMQKGSCVLIATHQYDLIQEFPGRVFRINNNHIKEIRMEDV